MSEIRGTKIDSLLPEDIESLINKINSEIAILDRTKFDLTNETEATRKELESVKINLKNAQDSYNKIVSESEAISSGLKDRENKISQKESALDVYANALQEKERNVNKYIAVFDGIRNVLKK